MLIKKEKEKVYTVNWFLTVYTAKYLEFGIKCKYN